MKFWSLHTVDLSAIIGKTRICSTVQAFQSLQALPKFIINLPPWKFEQNSDKLGN